MMLIRLSTNGVLQEYLKSYLTLNDLLHVSERLTCTGCHSMDCDTGVHFILNYLTNSTETINNTFI